MQSSDTIEEVVEGAVVARGLVPLLYVVSGSRAYGLSDELSDWDVVGIHISSDILEHPRYQTVADVQLWKDLEFKEPQPLSIVSYEAWKYIDLLVKGGFTAWEIEGIPELNILPRVAEFVSEIKYSFGSGAPTSAFVYSAIGNAKSDMFSDALNRKKCMMGYYRLCQAGTALIEGTVIHDKRVIPLFDMAGVNIPLGKELLSMYQDSKYRRTPLAKIELDHAKKEVEKILIWLENKVKTGPHVKLTEDRLLWLLKSLKRDRIGLIKEMK